MAKHLLLSWTTPSDGGNTRSPSWEDVAGKLDRIRGGSGSVELEILDALSPGPEHLQVRADGCCYVVTLGEQTADGNIVRTFENPDRTGWVDIGGQNFGAHSVIEDFEPVIRVFREFYETGDVSRELLR